MLKPPVPEVCSDLYVRLRDIAEKQVPGKLKPIVDAVTRQYYVASDPIRIQKTFPVSYQSVSGRPATQLTTLM